MLTECYLRAHLFFEFNDNPFNMYIMDDFGNAVRINTGMNDAAIYYLTSGYLQS